MTEAPEGWESKVKKSGVVPPGTYPLPYHYTWNIVDSSKLKTFMDCPRRYFYEYILGWRSDRPNNHLVFGEAWHSAMEILLFDKSPAGVVKAYETFLAKYRKVFPEATDDLMAPKDPLNALDAMTEYAGIYKNDSFSVQHVEVSGTVPISDRYSMHFRIDAALEDENGHFGMDHKTGSRVDSLWMHKWAIDIQMGCYTHALYCFYGPSKVWGYIVNGVFFQKKENKFQRASVLKTLDMMQVWLDTVNFYFQRLETEFKVLQTDSPNAPVMKSFPQNPESCTKYFGCPFLSMCSSWANPLAKCEAIPVGYQVDRWDPSLHQLESKEVVDFTPAEAGALLPQTSTSVPIGGAKMEETAPMPEEETEETVSCCECGRDIPEDEADHCDFCGSTCCTDCIDTHMEACEEEAEANEESEEDESSVIFDDEEQ